jgi:hypothetical protein
VRITNLSAELDSPIWQVVNIWQASAPFHRLIHNEKIAAEVTKLAATSELRVWHDGIQYKPVMVGGTNAWPQDSPY